MNNYTMHDLILDVVAGRQERGFAMFDYNENGEITDRDAYAQHIPGLIHALNGERGLNLYKADILLLEIMPDEPDASTVNALIEKMLYRGHQVVLSKILARIKMPDGVNFEPLFDLFKDPSNHLTELVRALKHVAVPETEDVVLKELRRGLMRSREAIQAFTETLALQGTMRSIPVLIAVSMDYTADIQNYLIETMSEIFRRKGVPWPIQQQLVNPANWKMNWDGTPEMFAGFVEFIALHMVGDPNGRDLTNHIGEIFRKEMRVDISPYQNFEALRLCSAPKLMIAGIANLKDNLEHKYLLEALMEDTDILPSSETTIRETYFDLMNDYLMTRLRRHFSFPEDL